MNAAFSIFSAASARRARSNGVRAAARRAARAARRLRGPAAGPAHRRATAPAAVAQASSSGLAGRVAFCAAASCAADSGSVDDVEVVGGPLAQLGGAPRPRGDGVAVDPGQLRHPGRRIDRRPLETHRLVQFAAQGGLIDHPGRAGLVIQRRAIDRHHLPVGAGLAVGHDDMGVQVRIPAPRGLVLVGDRPPIPAAAPGLSRRCAGCAPGCSRRVRPGTPSPRPARWCARRRSP